MNTISMAETNILINNIISLSTVLGIGGKSYGFQKFCALKINLVIGFTRKNRLECIGKAVMMLYLG